MIDRSDLNDPPALPSAWTAGPTVALLYLLIAMPLVRTAPSQGQAAFDQYQFHLPTIRQFVGQWPHVDLSNYPSATTPGYHLLMAGMARWFNATSDHMRILTATMTAALLAIVAIWTARRTGPIAGIALTVPLACSPYVFTSGVWLSPQNLAWLGVAGVLMIALRRRTSVMWLVVASLLLLVVVLMRQIHLWVAAPLWVAGLWTGVRLTRMQAKPPSGEVTSSTPHPQSAIRNSPWLPLIATAPAIGVLIAFARLWGGLTPPGEPFATLQPAGNWAVPGTVLAVAAVLGVFFCTFWPRETWRQLRRGGPIRRAALIGAAVGLLLAAIPESTYSIDAGRWSGIWNLLQGLPTFGGRSPAFIALATAGSGMLAIWLASVPRRQRLVLAAALLAFTVAHTAVGQAWQRYYEPFLLILFAMLAAIGWGDENDDPDARPRAALLGPAALAVLLAFLTVRTMTGAPA